VAGVVEAVTELFGIVANCVGYTVCHKILSRIPAPRKQHAQNLVKVLEDDAPQQLRRDFAELSKPVSNALKLYVFDARVRQLLCELVEELQAALHAPRAVVCLPSMLSIRQRTR
jgi:hypothetical protein